MSQLAITGSKPFTFKLDDKSQSLGLYFNEETMTIEGVLTEIPEKGKLSITLEAYNPYTDSTKGKNKPITLALTVNIVPEIVITASNLESWDICTAWDYDEKAEADIYIGDYYEAPARIGQAFSAKFEAEGAKKWDFIIKNMTDEEVNILKDGQSIIKKLKGKFEGLTFADDGTISGTPSNEPGSYGHISFCATASTPSGTVTKWVRISMGYPPALDEDALSVHATVRNNTTTNIDLKEYLNLESMRFYSDGGTDRDTYGVPSFKFVEELPPWIETAKFFRWEVPSILKVKPAFTDAEDLKSYPLEFVAVNGYGEARGTLIIDVQAAITKSQTASAQEEPALQQETSDSQEAEADSQDVKPSEGLKVIRERAVSELDAGTLGQVRKDGYDIAAVLPVMSVDVSGTYELDVVLKEGVKAGAKLVWFAFPDSGDGSDEAAAEFWDEAGAEILGVPESRKVTVSVWLNEGVIYAPVIAVKR